MTVVFAGGSERAGTTLLHSILCSTRRTPPPVAEDSTVRHLVLAYEDAIRWFDRHTRFVFDDRDQAAAFFRGMILRYLQHLRSRWPEAEHVVVKQPLLTSHFPTMAALMPRARFVIMVRDPRDVIASLRRVAEREGAELGTSASIHRDMPFYVRRMMSFYRRPLAAFGPRDGVQVMWVRYEDLVAAPENAARRLGDFTGIDLSGYQSAAPWRGWDDGTVDIDERRTAPFFSPLWGGPVTTERVAAWQEILSEEEAAEVARAMAGFMQAFGYADAAAPAAPTTTDEQE